MNTPDRDYLVKVYETRLSADLVVMIAGYMKEIEELRDKIDCARVVLLRRGDLK